MLKHISSIWEYRDFLSSQETHLDSSQFKRLNSSLFRSALHKLRKLDPGLVSDLLCSLYSAHGRPAIDPAVLLVWKSSLIYSIAICPNGFSSINLSPFILV